MQFTGGLRISSLWLRGAWAAGSGFVVLKFKKIIFRARGPAPAVIGDLAKKKTPAAAGAFFNALSLNDCMLRVYSTFIKLPLTLFPLRVMRKV